MTLTPLQKKIREMLETFDQREPYITNVAIRISSLMPEQLMGVTHDSLKKLLRVERNRGYSNGYAAGKKAGDR